jgi:hypothetical protein
MSDKKTLLQARAKEEALLSARLAKVYTLTPLTA